ncbi:phosphoribosyl-ATP pyrophosphatase [Neorhodopirellula lusitana]|uniref:Phosphoribosyl-ATP pyrophosphatase n=2 Tax=Neorhodopirellula lusitana TaxID=445327 RepID=A0ABY1QKS4_9BACT|nr:phosphoribosyl-ATP pyrophosphatase [Neorhodopirellula lusitana]
MGGTWLAIIRGPITIWILPLSSKTNKSPVPAPSSDPLLPLSRLMTTLAERAVTRPPGSYTTKLLEGGTEAIGKKIREEAEELIEAVDEDGDEGRKHAVYEAGDLIYHTLVMLAHRGIHLDEVAAELARREGTSGLAEKAARKKGNN